jgi:hypothetical protein
MSSSKERGPLLTVWLVLMLVANIGTMLLYLILLFSPEGRNLFFPGFAIWSVYLFVAVGAWNIFCVCFLLLWKKWAFFGLCISAVIALVVNLYVGVGAFAFLGLVGVVVTYLVLRQKWKMFENL